MKLEMTSVQKLARVLRVLIIALFVVNIVMLLLVPGLIHYSFDWLDRDARSWIGVEEGLKRFANLWAYDHDDAMAWWLLSGLFANFTNQQTASIMLFLWLCGASSAVLLWQAKRVLDTVLFGETFSRKNAANMMRAAVCCFVISVAALIRLVWGLLYFKSSVPLISYNTLFIPVFLVAGLICIVMSALFRQAAELKEENDLTI